MLFRSLDFSSIETIIKKSDEYKLLGEIHWFETIPNEIKDLFPAFMKGTKYNQMDLLLNKKLICDKPYWYDDHLSQWCNKILVLIFLIQF